MTLNEHVYAIKNLLSNGPVSDDFSYSNRLIAHFLQVSRAKLIEQKANRYHYISEQSYQDLCVDLELSNFHSCCTNPDVDCKVLKSTTTIPKFLNSNWGNFVKVLDLAGRVIPEFTLMQTRYSQFALSTNNNNVGWFIHNNYLYVVNSNVLAKVLLNALFDDPNSIHNLNCPASNTSCPDFMSEEFPIDADLIDDMYRLTLDYLGRFKELPRDTENNARDTESREVIQ